MAERMVADDLRGDENVFLRLLEIRCRHAQETETFRGHLKDSVHIGQRAFEDGGGTVFLLASVAFLAVVVAFQAVVVAFQAVVVAFLAVVVAFQAIVAAAITALVVAFALVLVASGLVAAALALFTAFFRARHLLSVVSGMMGLVDWASAGNAPDAGILRGLVGGRMALLWGGCFGLPWLGRKRNGLGRCDGYRRWLFGRGRGFLGACLFGHCCFGCLLCYGLLCHGLFGCSLFRDGFLGDGFLGDGFLGDGFAGGLIGRFRRWHVEKFVGGVFAHSSECLGERVR